MNMKAMLLVCSKRSWLPTEISRLGKGLHRLIIDFVPRDPTRIRVRPVIERRELEAILGHDNFAVELCDVPNDS